MKQSSATVWLLGCLLAATVYLGFYLTRNWYPHDEGALGQTAERVLQGEVPHRDFDEPYTGLLTYVHAAAFAVGGIRLPVLRFPLLVMTLVWLAAVFRIALRSTGPPGAAAVTLVAMLWSVPNYPASMPSWYNLFFATFGSYFLIRWLEDHRARWLVLAGAAGGISFLFKLSGLFFIAGALLFLLYATQTETEEKRPARGADILLRVALSAALIVFVLLLLKSVRPYYLARVIYHFVFPGAVIALALLVREWAPRPMPASPRLRSLFGVAIPFLIGVAAPVLLFAAGFAVAGALPALLNGVFVAPFRRIAFANMQPPQPYWILAAAPIVMLLRPREGFDKGSWRLVGLVTAALLAVMLYLTATHSYIHRFTWMSVRGLIPATALLAALVMVWPGFRRMLPESARDRFVLLAIVAALTSLIQFPFSAPTYFLYVAPLLLLAMVALVQGIGRTPPALSAATLGFYGFFVALAVTPLAYTGLGFLANPDPQARLDLPRGGLTIRAKDAELYGGLVRELTAHAPGGKIWAGPDAPELYFLGGFRNPSRAVFDFLGDRSPEALLHELSGAEAVVVNTAPSFSPPLPPEVMDSLRRVFPEGHTADKFEIRWRR